jgi:Tfp pilus assembly pilus retraction ATPase PilT
MMTLDDSLLALYMARKISKEDCIQFSRDPEKMKTKVF